MLWSIKVILFCSLSLLKSVIHPGDTYYYCYGFLRFIGQRRDNGSPEIGETHGHDDSGYETPPKRKCGNIPPVSPALVNELEQAYEELYLCTPRSLRVAYARGDNPPHRNSATKYLAAINSTPGWSRSISQQLERVRVIRDRGLTQGEVVGCDN